MTLAIVAAGRNSRSAARLIDFYRRFHEVMI